MTVSKKRLGIDARLAGQTGVGTYIRNLLQYLPKKDHIHLIIFALPEDCKMLNELVPNATIVSAPYRWHTFQEQLGFWYTIQKQNLDLMHFTYFSYPVGYQGRFIATVHDLTPLTFATGKASTKHPLLYQLKSAVFRWVLHQQVSRAAAIITPTKSVKREIEQRYGEGINQKKIHPIYEGVDAGICNARSDESELSGLNPGFFLYVGNFYPHKNLTNLIKGYASAQLRRTLVCAGPDDFFAKRIRSEVKAIGIENQVRFVHHPSQDQLAWLYSNAHALVHPSLSEGFGLPIVEAMQFQLPVIASDISVFREILQDQYLSFDPYSVESIANSLQEADKRRKSSLPIGDSSRFSFQQMADKTMDLYSSVLDQP